MNNTKFLATFCVIFLAVAASSLLSKEVHQQSTLITKYLLFQIFVADSSAIAYPRQGEVAQVVNDIVARIGSTGDNHNKLGFAVGPLSFNQSDDQTRRLIRESFKTAKEKNVAVAFHIDCHIFWEKRNDLYEDKNNIEWLDWKGTRCTGARLDWGPKPTKAPAQMCFNSPAIKAAVLERADVIGDEIKSQVELLRRAGKEELFAGVMVGWETRIARDFDTDRCLGYHALSNKGFTSITSQAQCDLERTKIVKEFIEMWARSLIEAGISSDKIYGHIAFTPQGLGERGGLSYAQRVGFATPETAFSKYYRPGFSTYPEEGIFEEIDNELVKGGRPPWASAEGTNVVPNGIPGESTMETYLGKMFNHRAVIVNIFSWGIGGEREKGNLFRRATENEEALSAYRKFLSGKALEELPKNTNAFSPAR